jgi:hypothetical protein
MDYKKITVIPQITIYQNILKDCDQIVNFLKKDYDDKSVFSKWENWYNQGTVKKSQFNKNHMILNEEDSDLIKEEKNILNKIKEVYDFVKKDYLDEYENKKGIWPSYINEWESVKQEPSYIDLNVYKYAIENDKKRKFNDLAMEYHYDEMPTEEFANKEHCLITITFYINDEYNGGEICFYDESSNKAYKYKPKAGDVTIFPSGKPFYHGVSEYSKSDRYFMRTFILYKSNGTKEWNDNYSLYGEDFIKKERDKTQKFIEDGMHNVTLVFPKQKVPYKIYGKLIHLEENIIEVK